MIAKSCGITTSEYLRLRALYYQPKQALSEEEIEKMCRKKSENAYSLEVRFGTIGY